MTDGTAGVAPAGQEIALSVIVPCFNEAENLPELVSRLRATAKAIGVSSEVVLIDDGSTDGTWAVMQDLAAASPCVVPVQQGENAGMVAAWRRGLGRACGAVVVLIDADLQYQPEDIAVLWRALAEGGADIVQGVRITDPATRDARYLLSRGFNRMLNTAFGMRLRDNKSGFIAARREVVSDVLDHRRRYRYFQALLLVSAHAKGYRIREIPTQFQPRRRGSSFMSGFPVGVVWGCLLDLGQGVVEYRLERPGSARCMEDHAAAAMPSRPGTA